MSAGRVVVFLLIGIALIGGCSPSDRPTVASPSPPATSTASPSPRDPTSSPISPDADLADAIARWSKVEKAGFGYTVESGVSGLSGTTDRVIGIEGHWERVPIQISAFSSWGDEQVTVPGMFDLIQAIRGRSGTVQATYDPVLGYPATINREEPSASDGDWSMRVVDVRSSLDTPASDGGLARRLADARAAWTRWAPSDYTYEWQQVASGDGKTPAAAWSIRHVDGVTTAAQTVGDGASVGQDAASIPATFDAIEAAMNTGAWVDAVFDPVLGLPIVVGIEPTPAVGDGWWIKIAFHDIVAETGRAELQAAHDRWTVQRPTRYSYVWREEGGGRHWTYRVAMNGDVAKIRASGGAPVGEAATLAPRIDDLFMLIEEALANGGHVDAAYEEQFGYPTRVKIDAPGSLVVGTITIRSMVIDATP